MKEKTEKPTPKRLRDARKKGQVAKSKEIATCAAIVGMFGFLWIFFDSYLKHISQMILMPSAYYRISFDRSHIECIKGAVEQLVLLSVPFALMAMVIITLAYMLQFGVLFAFEAIKPDFKKINPVEGFKRIFSLDNLLELIKSIVKIIFLGSIIYLLIKDNIKALIDIPSYGLQTLLAVLASIMKKLAIYVSCVFIVVAIVDYFFQKYLHIRKLKMSLDEIRREYKDREGDPHVKLMRSQIHRGLIMDDMVGKIQNSTVIITHSQKIAIAVYYEYGKTQLPIIQLKGKALMAERIIAIAGKSNIPVVQEPALAFKLSQKGQENNYIPHDLVEPVAMVLRTVMGLA